MKLEENVKEIDHLEDANCKRKPDIPNKLAVHETMPTFPSTVDLLRTRPLYAKGRGGSVRYKFLCNSIKICLLRVVL